jgi:hypothetical protein
MALSILDGNQSATTLSTILSSGQHITAHTVVSLGTQAKTDILAAVSSGIAISGTVTASNISSLPDTGNNPVIRSFIFGYDYDEEVPVAIATDGGNALVVSLSGAVAANLNSALPAGTNQIGSVTANSSNGSLTTRFGSVTTANTAFATSAVTNANRKYLLIQNITTASNAITVGIGFTPTTTQGIQLSSGAVITFEGNYIPTGAVNLLSSVTASCFTILEA